MVMTLGLMLGGAIILFSIILLWNSRKRFTVKEVEGYYGIWDRANGCFTNEEYGFTEFFRNKEVAEEIAEELNNKFLKSL